jgi:hypothetical protein
MENGTWKSERILRIFLYVGKTTGSEKEFRKNIFEN